jgi:hypothetical protein
MNAIGPVPVTPEVGVRRWLSPEIAAVGLVVVVVVAAVLPPLLPRFSFGSAPGPASTPTPTLALPSASPGSGIDTGSIGLLLELNSLIGQSEKPLKDALAHEPLDTQSVRSEMSSIVVNVRLGLDAAEKIQSDPATRAIGKTVEAFYESLQSIAQRSFDASLVNEPAHRRAAQDMVAALAQRAEIDAALERLLVKSEEPAPSPPAPSTEVTKPPSPSPTSTATSTPRAAGSPTPSVPVPGDVIVNGGFENGAVPWSMTLRDPSAVAKATLDSREPRFGTSALRVDITTGSDSRAGIAVEQPRVTLTPGRYVMRLYARAAAARDILVAVTSTDGGIYGARVLSIGPVWTSYEFQFTALTSDSTATVEFDFGQSTPSVWLDAISVAPAT